jgi:F0F1-type ATP synthase assembly protein I
MAGETHNAGPTWDGPELVRTGAAPGSGLATDAAQKSDTAKALATSGRAWAIGLNFVYGVIGFGLIGWALEKWVWPQASPWIMLGALGLGLLGGGVRFVREAIAMGKKAPRR